MVSGCLLSLESPNNNECNGKENVKTNRFHKQKNNLHAQHTVWYISLPSLHDHDVNFLMRRVMETWKHVDEILSLFLTLSAVPKNSTPG